jgi:hypothetical protein
MASIGDLFLKIKADLKGFDAELQKGAAKSGDKAVATMGGRMSKGFKEVGKGLGAGLGLGAGIAAFGALDSAVSGIVGSFGKAVDAASDFREASALGGQVFEDNADQIEAWAETAAESMGASATEAINLSAQFGNAFKNVGFSLDETTAKSMELAELAGDLGSAFNRSSEEAATALRSGLLGESEPLRAFGVFLSDAAVKTKAVELGIADLGDELTDQQKVTARYAIIMESTADSAGMFGRDTDSLADAQKRLGAQVENIARNLGEKLVPVLAEVVTWVGDEALPAIMDLAAGVGDFIETVDDARKSLNDLLAIDLGTDEGLQIVSQEDVQLVNDIADGIGHWGQEVLSLTGAVESNAEEQERLNDDISIAIADGDAYARRQAEIGAALNNVEQDAEDVADEIEDIGETATDSARESEIAARRMAQAISNLAVTFGEKARQIIANFYDPIQTQQELSAVQVELTEARKRLAEAETAAQRREAQAEITDLMRQEAELQAEVVSQMGVLSAEGDAYLDDLTASWREATGKHKEYLASVRRALLDLRYQAYITSGAIRNTGAGIGDRDPSGPGSGYRAAGGPITAGNSYWVGEEGPELIVPRASAHVLDAATSASIAGGGGGDIYNIQADLHGLPMRATSPFEVGQQMRRVASMGVIRPRRRMVPASG